MLKSWDERRDYIIGNTQQEALLIAAEHWIHTAQKSIQQRGRFVAALSGGSTPRAIYEHLRKTNLLDWSKIWLFFSDERAVPPDHSDSNYKMAIESCLAHVPIPPSQVFRMQAESDIERQAQEYEEKIRHHLDRHLFDLVMLGVGEDGHTASLFPHTRALSSQHLIDANYLPDKKTWRMTFTFSCINQSRSAVFYAIGKSKANIVFDVLHAAIDSPFPASKIGTKEHKALWILDREAALKLSEE